MEGGGGMQQNVSILSTYYVLVKVLSYHIEPPEYQRGGPIFPFVTVKATTAKVSRLFSLTSFFFLIGKVRKP